MTVIDGETGLVIEPDSMALVMPDETTYDEWINAGKFLSAVNERVWWLVGDWWNYGSRKWGDGRKHAKAAGLNYQQCANAGWVAKSFEFSRRRENLGWSIHMELAALPPEKADEILDSAPTQAQAREAAQAHKRGDIPPVEPGQYPPKLYHCSLEDLPIQPGSVDAIITDPPYPREFLPLYSTLAKCAATWLKPGGSVLALSGHIWLPEIFERMSEHLDFNWVLCYQNANGNFASAFDRRVTNIMWKPIVHYTRGKCGHGFSDLIVSDAPDKDFHEWGQSISGFSTLIERFTYPGDLVVDPFLGGGTTAVAASQLGRRFIGCDVDLGHVETARARFAA